MRVKTILLAAFWVGMFVWVAFNGMQAVSSYFQVNEIAEQAFREAADKQRSRNPGELFSSDFIADFRAGIVTRCRRSDIELDVPALKVAAEGGLVRVTAGWTYRTWPLTLGGWDSAIPVPLWLGRGFDPQLGIRRIF